MGFFSKIFKGVKKVVSKIGKGIKNTVKKVGKFMNKVGIVGQIALAFVLPGIGSMLGSGLAAMGQFGASLGGTIGGIIQGAAKFATGVGRAFQTVSSGVKNFIGEFAKTAASKLGFNVTDAATNFFGSDGAFAKAYGQTGETWSNSTWGYSTPEAAVNLQSGTEDIIGDMTKTYEENLASRTRSYGVGTTSDLTRNRLPPIEGEFTTIEVTGQRLTPSLLEPVQVDLQPDPIDVRQYATVDVPDIQLPEAPKPTLFEAARGEIQAFGESVVEDITERPISTAITASRALGAYGSEDEYAGDAYGSYGGSPMIMSPTPVYQADPLQFIQAGTPYGYAQGLYDNIYRGGTWQRNMAGGYA